MSYHDSRAIIQLYKAYIHQIKQLPVFYLRQYFRVKATDDLRAISRSSDSLRDRKLKRVSKDLRKIKAANNGCTKAFAHILDLAYGRKGKLKRELIMPLFSGLNTQVPPQIIRLVEKSRPPVYSPELKALLTSSLSRKTKPLSLRLLDFPSTLPIRADPSSEDARLLGPFSKRREVNLRWRYFTQEWKKVRPPLHAVENVSPDVYKDTPRAGIGEFDTQGQSVREEAEVIAGPSWMAKTPTRKELRSSHANFRPLIMETRHPSRWLRRRYQQLLGRMPILTVPHPASSRILGGYTVSLASNALVPAFRFSARAIPEIGCSDDQNWLQLSFYLDRRAKERITVRKT